MAAFQPGRLWQKIVDTSAAALRSGALQPIPTAFEIVPDAGVQFLVRVVERLADKPRTGSPAASRAGNPFLPHEPALYIAGAGDRHLCLLNKFNVVDHHLLIVTRAFEHQERPLNLGDFAAWWRCLLEYDSLGFYNSGTVAGASQPHKHLQVVPLPLARPGPRVPLEPLLQFSREGAQSDPFPELPFHHAAAPLPSSAAGSREDLAGTSQQLYRALLRLTGLDETLQPDGRLGGAYNLLMTRRWMLLVPRRCEHFQGISLNALAFAGALLAKDHAQLELLRRQGPMAALVHTAAPRGNRG